jgi:hypothetical protein
MSPGDELFCIFCMAPTGLQVRVDKRGRPYMMCNMCGTRCFIHGSGWKGPQALWGKLALALQHNLVDGARDLMAKGAREWEEENAKRI